MLRWQLQFYVYLIATSYTRIENTQVVKVAKGIVCFTIKQFQGLPGSMIIFLIICKNSFYFHPSNIKVWKNIVGTKSKNGQDF